VLLTNNANGFYTSKWTFLNGEEFYRVSDDSDECLLDLVSSDEIIYILDENQSNNSTDKKHENDENTLLHALNEASTKEVLASKFAQI
jgi:hypothetical protein